MSVLAFTGAVYVLAGEAQRTGAGKDSIVRQSMRIAKASGFSLKDETTRFSGKFIQAGNAPIVMEAECAMFLSVAEGNGVGFDPTASGGGYVTRIGTSGWRFLLKTPGRYTLWTRSSFPRNGEWSHAETIDEIPRKTIKDLDVSSAPANGSGSRDAPTSCRPESTLCC